MAGSIAASALARRAQNFKNVLQCIRCIDSGQASKALLADLERPAKPFIVSFVNAHAANLAWNDPLLVSDLLDSDLLLRDGIGVEIGLRAFGVRPGVNMNGTDLIPAIATAYSGRTAALFGTASPWLERARARLESGGLEVVASRHGFDPPDTYLRVAAETRPELIILAMGMPRQEQLAIRLREHLSHPVLIVNGGAILDFLGGKVDRAPKIMRDTGMEWAYRLRLEPRRLARRYLLGIPAFFGRVVVARIVDRGAQLTSIGEVSA